MFPGALLFAFHLAAALLYFAAAMSGWRVLKTMRPVAGFRLRDLGLLMSDWLRFVAKPKEGRPESGAPAWGLIWLAVYFSAATSMIFLLLLIRLMVITHYPAADWRGLYYIPAHFGGAIGAILLHMGAFIVISRRSE